MARSPDHPISRSPDAFYSGAYARIIRFMMALGIVATIAVLVRFDAAVAAGFVVGCAIAFLNFHWLKRVVGALADRATATGERQSSKGVVARFLLRYFLIALAAYAIFTISRDSMYGLLAGLFLPVGAILAEAVYEMYAALRRGVCRCPWKLTGNWRLVFMEQLPFTAFLNKYFGGFALALMHALHIRPAYPKTPIANFVAMETLVAILLLLFFLLVRTRLSVESPGGLQHVVEGLHGFIQHQSEEIIGHHSERFTPFLTTLFVFILLSNLLGVIPGFESPTATPSVPLGCAVLAFLYYNLQGFKAKGAHYLADFLGPVWWLSWLMLPIELISHMARMLSLTIRLFANMFAGDMVTLVFFSLVPLGVPVIFLGLHIGVSLLQAYIFTLLTTVYLSGAVAAAH